MAAFGEAAVRYSVKVCEAEIPGGVKADGGPQIAGPADEDAKENADGSDRQQADRRLTGICVVVIAEPNRREQRRGPESDAGAQREQNVAAPAIKAELFLQANQQKRRSPQSGVGPRLGTVQGHAFET